MLNPKVREVQVRAPAKINLILKVLGRLPNGYHELWSIMQTVDLFDHVSLRTTSSSQGIQLICPSSRVPQGPDNIVYRAAALVLKKADIHDGVEISLEKQIPMGAGLGGGSSDAAATIFGLVQLFQLRWSWPEMTELGAELGSDVPFFFYGPQALIRGWGQDVTPMTITGSRWILLVNPGFSIETGWAYQQIAQSRTQIPRLSAEFQALQQREALDFQDLLPHIENDFEPALFPARHRLNEIKDELCSLGADVALLSGSGSTVFGVFSEEHAAVKASEQMRRDPHMQVFCVPTSSSTLALIQN
ncbi:MAG: 4-diphosphocytidyl-2-C-methyl-D-erythritol kinase [Nitrospirales bacterium]|nr:MAG: 4-diphosphocytidyl-2-C-methyl-D-erythritol kinase [Nitrospirales bacterium]